MKISRGWKVHNNITDDDINVLKTALSELIGIEYEPKILATQSVNGTNYCFICKSKVAAHNGQGISKVMIYKPLTGKAKITSIECIL